MIRDGFANGTKKKLTFRIVVWSVESLSSAFIDKSANDCKRFNSQGRELRGGAVQESLAATDEGDDPLRE